MKVKKYAYMFGAIGAFLIFFTNVENVKSSVSSSLLFCSRTLIPSLLIYMIICSLILYTKALEPFFDLLPDKVFKVLGICRKYASIVFLSSLCGFVNGPKALCEDYSVHGGDRKEFSNAVILSSNAGIAFLIGCVGGAIWGNYLFGTYLFFVQILSSILLGKLLLKSNLKDYEKIKKNDNLSKKSTYKISFSSAISKSVTSSALTLISICAFVIFFSCVVEILLNFLGLNSNSTVHTILKILSEFCQGSFQVLNFNSNFWGAFFSGFCIGFGGICVHFQTFAVCEGYPLDKKMFVIFKLFHGIICGILSLIYVAFTQIEPNRDIVSTSLSNGNYRILGFIYALLFVFIIFFIIKKIFSKFILIFR